MKMNSSQFLAALVAVLFCIMCHFTGEAYPDPDHHHHVPSHHHHVSSGHYGNYGGGGGHHGDYDNHGGYGGHGHDYGHYGGGHHGRRYSSRHFDLNHNHYHHANTNYHRRITPGRDLLHFGNCQYKPCRSVKHALDSFFNFGGFGKK